MRKRWKDNDNPESMTVGQMASLYLMREAKKRYEPIEVSIHLPFCELLLHMFALTACKYSLELHAVRIV